jgi:hypothetical protein
MSDQTIPRPLEERLVALLLVFQESSTDGHDHNECEEYSCGGLSSQALDILARKFVPILILPDYHSNPSFQKT